MSANAVQLGLLMNARLQEAFALEKAAWDQSQRLYEFLTFGGAERMRRFHLALFEFRSACRRTKELGRMPTTMRRLEAMADLVSDLIGEGSDAAGKIRQLEAALKVRPGDGENYDRCVSVFRVWARQCESYAARLIEKTR